MILYRNVFLASLTFEGYKEIEACLKRAILLYYRMLSIVKQFDSRRKDGWQDGRGQAILAITNQAPGPSV